MADKYLIDPTAEPHAWALVADDLFNPVEGQAAGDGLGIDSPSTLLLSSGGDLNFGNDVDAFGQIGMDFTGYASTATLQVDTWLGPIDLAAGALATGAFDIAPCTSFSMSGGTLTGSGAIDVAGNISITGGTMSHTGTWTQTVTGTVANATGGAGHVLAHIVLGSAGVVSTLADDVHSKGFTFGTGDGGVSVAGPTKRLYVEICGTSSWVQPADAGSISMNILSLYLYDDGSLGHIHDLTLASNAVYLTGVIDDKTLTAIGDFDFAAAALTIKESTNAKWAAMAMGAFRLTAGVVTLGDAGAGKGGGRLGLTTGVLDIVSIEKAALSDAAENALSLDRGTVLCSDFVDGTTIVITAGGAHVHGGILRDADVTGQIHRFGATADSGNTNVVDCPSPIGPGVALMAA